MRTMLRMGVRVARVSGAGMLIYGLARVQGLVAFRSFRGYVVPVIFPKEDGCGELCLGEHLVKLLLQRLTWVLLLLLLWILLL